MDRISSGVPEFDELIEGGFPKGSLILLTGGTGTGKTIFSGNFTFAGLKNNEKVIYVTFTDTGPKLQENFKRVGMDFTQYKENVKFLGIPVGDQLDVETMTNEVLDVVRKMNASRLVIDSVNAMTSCISRDEGKRSFMTVLYRILQKRGCTTLAIVEVPRTGKSVGHDMLEFISDGVIQMNSNYIEGELKRDLRILKMKNTNHSKKIHEYTISSEGLKIIES